MIPMISRDFRLILLWTEDSIIDTSVFEARSMMNGRMSLKNYSNCSSGIC